MGSSRRKESASGRKTNTIKLMLQDIPDFLGSAERVGASLVDEVGGDGVTEVGTTSKGDSVAAAPVGDDIGVAAGGGIGKGNPTPGGGIGILANGFDDPGLLDCAIDFNICCIAYLLTLLAPNEKIAESPTPTPIQSRGDPIYVVVGPVAVVVLST
jgi:hypothetical protein